MKTQPESASQPIKAAHAVGLAASNCAKRSGTVTDALTSRSILVRSASVIIKWAPYLFFLVCSLEASDANSGVQ